VATIREWWSADPNERFWLEATDRLDLGHDLHAPAFDEEGKEYWGYSLVRHCALGDVVMHYQKPTGIVAFSLVSGLPEPIEMEWIARGSSARGKGLRPYMRPGYRVSLTGFRPFPKPLTLSAIREKQAAISETIIALRDDVGAPIYFPFELSESRPLRPLQAYVSKLPSAFVDLFPELLPAQHAINCGINDDGSRAGQSDALAREGALRERLHRYRERDGGLPRLKKLKALADRGQLRCEVCGFSFREKYGDIGKSFIECPPQDGMIHGSKPWLTLEQLRKHLRSLSRATIAGLSGDLFSK